MDVVSNDERRLVERDPCPTRIACILAVVDFARSLDATLRRAALLAAEHRAQLTLLHVVDPAGSGPCANGSGGRPTSSSSSGRRGRRSIAWRSSSRVATASMRVSSSASASAAGDRPRGAAADLVVVGAKGANPLRELLLGRTPAEGLLRTVRRPLLLVRRPARQFYRRALVPLDFAACSGGRCSGRRASRRVPACRPSTRSTRPWR
jgi:nucleotide-binding universal stress UspA family protein